MWGNRMKEGYQAWKALKSRRITRGLGIKAKYPYKGVIVPMVLYGSKAYSMRGAERKKVNVFEMNFLRSLVGMIQMDKIKKKRCIVVLV